MFKSCKYCGRIHPREFECPKKPPEKPYRKNKQSKEKFRSTQAWQKTRDAIVFRDMGLCQVCLDEGIYNKNSLEVHHIVPLVADFSKRLDRYNLITLCPIHHKMADAGLIDAAYLLKMAEKNEGEPDERVIAY